MSETRSPLAAEELTRHAGFLRALARGLVSDEANGDDVVQASFLAALERPPADASRPRAWLARVAQNAARSLGRGERRRGERERAVARPEATPAADASLERGETLRAVTAAVLDLEEPYRHVVLARYYEGLELVDYAAREGLPVATVRSRHARALARLRARLDREHGGRREAWSLARVGLVGLERRGGGLGSPLGAGTLAMGTTAKVASAVVVVAVLALFGRSLLTRDDLPREARGARPEVALVAPGTESGPRVDATELPAVEARAPLAPSETVRSAKLTVRVRWSDGTPATGVHVGLLEWARPEPFLHEREAVTDAEGSVAWEDLQPGGATVVIDRGGGGNVTVRQGETAQATFEIPRGVDVHGVVRDLRGAPVEGATIWLSPYANPNGCKPVAVSAADGRFRLRDVGNGHDLVARLAGRAPSPSRSVEGSVGDVRELEFVLQGAGAGLDVRVVDLEGRPIEGASVRLMQRSQDDAFEGYAAGTPFGRSLAYDARSDAEGRVRFEGLAPGDAALAVGSSGHAAFAGTLALAQGPGNAHEVRLGVGTTLVGRVLDPSGAPMAGARVSCGPYADLGRRETVSAADGSFRLEHVGAERSGPVAVDPGSGAKATFTGALREGETVHWDARLDAGRVVRGRLLDERGEPLAGWIVNAHASRALTLEAIHFWGQRETAEDGSFAVPNCPDTLLRLDIVRKERITEPAQVSFDGVAADGVPRDYVVPDDSAPTASVRGVLKLADGSPAALRVIVRDERSQWGRDAWSDVASGAFHVDGIVPGAYRVTAEDGQGNAIAPIDVELAPEQALDLGALLAGGPVPLTVSLHPEAGVDASQVRVSILSPTRTLVRELSPEELGDVIALPPGRYHLKLMGPCVPDVVPFELEPERPRHLDVPLRPFVLVRLEHSVAEGVAPPVELVVTFRDAAGEIVKTDRAYPGPAAWRDDAQPALSFHQLAPASGYAVEVETDSGLTGEAWVEPAPGGGMSARIELR